MTSATGLKNNGPTVASEVLDDCIHALAQPLTALLFRLELGALDVDPLVMRATLDDARTQCLRAVKALEVVRSAAHSLANTGELS